MTLDSNSRYCEADPYTGTLLIVAEAVRNLACTGARAVAATNCLNFGNPEHPQVMGQLREAIRGLGDACSYFGTPITGGNVSLYNQTGETNIKPTPAIGMLGVLEDVSKAVSAPFKKVGSVVALLGSRGDGTIRESEFGRTILGRDDLACPPIDLKEEQVLHRVLLQLIDERLLLSAHDASEGGLFQAMAECALGAAGRPIGFSVELPGDTVPAVFLFGEAPSRAIVTFEPAAADRVIQIARNHGIPLDRLGTTGGDELRVMGLFSIPTAEARAAHESFFGGL